MKFYLVSLIIILFNSSLSAQFGPQQIVSTFGQGYPDIITADLDGDNDMDIISIGNLDLVWFENINGLGLFGNRQIIEESPLEYGAAVSSIDLDGDGDLDILSSFDRQNTQGISKVTWYENLDGQGNFGSQIIINTNVNTVYTVLGADIDNDSDIDVFTIERNSGKISWYENIDGSGNFGNQILISTTLEWPIHGFLADMDNDDDIDIVTHSYDNNKIVWFENNDGQGNFSGVKVISTEVDRPIQVFCADIDGDNDLDVISTSLSDNKIAWYENINGQGSFGPQNIISTQVISPRNLYVKDLDNDGDQDIISSERDGSYSAILWFENLDGNGNFSSQILISDEIDYATTVYASDLDQDQDFDILSASQFDGKIAWYENYTILNRPDFNNVSEKIYPNPVKETLYIKSDEIIESLKIFNQTGQLIKSIINETEINIENFKSGLYFVQIEFQSGVIEFQKILKE